MNASLFKRIERQRRQLRIARFVIRLLRLSEVEALPIGEYAVVAGYVTLSNDLRDGLRKDGHGPFCYGNGEPCVCGLAWRLESAR